jgi:uncharacterized protein
MERSTFHDSYPLAQLGLTVITCMGCFVIFVVLGFAAAIPLFHISSANLTNEFGNLNNIPLQKYLQLVQAVGLFIIPSLILGKVFSGNSLEYLKLHNIPSTTKIALVVLIMLTAFPIINLLAELNSMLRLPEALQQYVDRTSKLYQTITESFMKAGTIRGLAVNLVVMAVIPAIGEEFLFRGVFQRILSNLTKNIHWGIIISAFIFSAVHMEFYGFFPRWALGTMFGYFLYWSGSIWLPILAHFINNATAVILFYLIAQGTADKNVADFGAGTEILPYTILCSLILGTGLFFLYKKSRN